MLARGASEEPAQQYRRWFAGNDALGDKLNQQLQEHVKASGWLAYAGPANWFTTQFQYLAEDDDAWFAGTGSEGADADSSTCHSAEFADYDAVFG